MEYGVFLNNGGINDSPSPWKYTRDLVKQIDELGYAYLSTGEHFDRAFDLPTMLGAVAEISPRLKLMTSILLIIPRGVVASAKFYASLDVMSGGRVIAGVAPGSSFRDYDMVGLSHADLWPRFEEGVRAMRTYLTPGAPPFRGRYYNTEGWTMEPYPVQKPLPIWIGSWGSDAGLRRVARLADGWFGSAGTGRQTPAEFGRNKKRLDGFLKEAGKDPTTFPNAVSTMPTFISEDRAEVERAVASRHSRPAYGPPRPEYRSNEDPSAGFIVGSRAECREKVIQWRENGAKALLISPMRDHPEQVRVFMEDVVAKL